MTTTSPGPGVTVREATPVDIEDVAELLSARDGQVRDRKTVSDYLWDLNPEHARAWLAYAGEQPVGITMLYLRRMNWPQAGGESVGKLQEIRAGYWAHLYVRPEFRSKMVYPQLVLAMLRGMAKAGLSVIFTATRQPQVAAGHQRLGFALVGKLTLKLRPVRPFRLLFKQKGLAALVPLAAPLDAIYWLFTGRVPSRSASIENVTVESPDIGEIVALMNARVSGAVAQIWRPDQFRRRFRTTLDGTNYRITAIRRNGRIAAALVMALAERGNQIRAGIVLELIAHEDVPPDELRALLADGRQHARQHGGEVILCLPSSLSPDQAGSTFRQYFTSRSENYHLLVYPKMLAQAPYLAAEADDWEFQFADHDAF